MAIDWSFAWECAVSAIRALPVTLLATFFPAVVGLIPGALIAAVRIRRTPVLNGLASLYNSFFRSVPLVVLLFLAYYGLPKLGNLLLAGGARRWSPYGQDSLAVALTALTMYAAAFLSEIMRGALRSVEPRQYEAARALGMTTPQTYFRVVIPQAAVTALPNYGNFCLGLLKGTSVVFTISVVDVMSAAKLKAEYGYRYVEAYIVAATFYILTGLILSRLFKALERRLVQPLQPGNEQKRNNGGQGL